MSKIRINKKLLFALKEYRITQKELASKTHLPEAYISRFINGTQVLTDVQEKLIWDVLKEKQNETENEE